MYCSGNTGWRHAQGDVTRDVKIDVKDLWFFDWFFKPFWFHFETLVSSALLPKICQNRKRRFYENELLVYTRYSFSRISASKIYSKIDEKKRSKMKHFFGPLLEGLKPFCDHFGIKIASKNRSKKQCDFESIFVWFWAYPGVHVGSLRAPGCHRDAPMTLQDALKRLPRCSQDAEGSQ